MRIAGCGIHDVEGDVEPVAGLVEHLEDCRAVVIDVRRYHEDVGDGRLRLPLRILFGKEPADAGMERFHLAYFRRGRRHAEGVVVLERELPENVRVFAEHVLAVRHHPLHVVEQRVAGHFAVPVHDGIAVEYEVVVGGDAPQLYVVSARLAPVAQELVFVFVDSFAFVVGRGSEFREHGPHAFDRLACAAAVFPEGHARVLDIGVHLVLSREFLQYHAVELPHARKAEDKDRECLAVLTVR